MTAAAPSADTLQNALRQRRVTPSDLLALSFYWLPTNLFWTVMLQTFLPGRVAEMVGGTHKGTYLLYISSLGAVATTVIQLIIGPISDACGSHWGRRRPFILGGTVLAAFFILWFARAENFVGLLLAFFGIQLFLNVATGPYQALMPDTVPASKHGVASAYMGIALLIGQLAGAMTLFGLAFLKPRPSIFSVLLVITVFLLVGALVTVLRVPDAPAPLSERASPLRALASLQSIGIRKHRDFFGLLYSRFFINLSYSTVTAFLLYYLQDSIGPANKAVLNQGMVILTATVAGLVGTIVAGRFADRISKKRLAYIACAILAAGALVFAFVKSIVLVLILAFVFGAGWGAFAAVDWALAVNLLPEGGAARYMAVWHVCLTLPQVIAPCFGPVADALNAHYGGGIGWRAAMIFTVVYLAIGARLLHRIKERDIASEAEGITIEMPLPEAIV